MLPDHGALQSPAYRRTTRLAAVAACILALLIFIFTLLPSFAETPYENPGLLFLLNAAFLSAVSFLVAGLALIGHLRSGRVELLLLGCARPVLRPGGADRRVDCRRGTSRPTISSPCTTSGSCWPQPCTWRPHASRRGTPLPPPASLRMAVVAYGATFVLILLVLVAERADVMPMFFIPGAGSTRTRQLVLTGTIALMSTAAGLLGLEARRLNGGQPAILRPRAGADGHRPAGRLPRLSGEPAQLGRAGGSVRRQPLPAGRGRDLHPARARSSRSGSDWRLPSSSANRPTTTARS